MTNEQFKKQGFVKIKALSSKMAASIKKACSEKLEAEGRILSSDGMTTQTMIPPYGSPEIKGLILHAHKKLTEMGFEDVVFWSSRLINKPPGEGERTWHQDWGYWTEDIAYGEAPEIGVMVYLQETKRENGALRVLPGAHKDVPRIKRIYTQVQGEQPDEVTLECSPNDFVIVDARLPHATHPNNSDQNRAMMTLWFIPNYKSLPREFQEYFFNTKETDIEGITPVLEGPLIGKPLPEFRHSNFRLPDYSVYLNENLAIEEEAWTRVNQEGDGHRIFSEAIKVLKPRSVIEFGCGTGWVAKDIHCRYTGVDSNLSCLELAMEKAPRGEFEWCDFREYEDKKLYDVSCCFAFLKHFPLNEWDNVFGRLLGFGKYSVFTMSIDEDKDNGTEYPHVYVSWEHINKEIEKSSVLLGKQKITEDEHGQEWLITTRRRE